MGETKLRRSSERRSEKSLLEVDEEEVIRQEKIVQDQIRKEQREQEQRAAAAAAASALKQQHIRKNGSLVAPRSPGALVIPAPARAPASVAPYSPLVSKGGPRSLGDDRSTEGNPDFDAPTELTVSSVGTISAGTTESAPMATLAAQDAGDKTPDADLDLDLSMMPEAALPETATGGSRIGDLPLHSVQKMVRKLTPPKGGFLQERIAPGLTARRGSSQKSMSLYSMTFEESPDIMSAEEALWDEDDGLDRQSRGCVHRTCLSSNYSLQSHLFLSFGLVSLLAITVLMTTAILTTTIAGKKIQSNSRKELTAWVKNNLGTSPRLTSDTLTQLLDSSLTAVLAQMTLDRFVGYPDADGYQNDSQVPFFDLVSKRNIYPTNSSKQLPLDWESGTLVNNMNHQEHVQHRFGWYHRPLRPVPGYFMQGSCDPSATDPSSHLYYPNCTDANNDLSTGGVVRPTSTNGMIAKKSADMSYVLKPLYEYHSDAQMIGVYFANEGAGSSLIYPLEHRDGTSTYSSIGCDWMNAPNPYDPNKTIGTPEAIRRCRPEGATVLGRQYNPLERGWCKQQALFPETRHIVGPYRDAFAKDLWLLTFGQAVYDRVTNEFIACTLADVGVDHIADIIDQAKVVGSSTSETLLVRWDEEGTIVASHRWDSTKAKGTTSIKAQELDLPIDLQTFHDIKMICQSNISWDASTAVLDQTFEYGDKLVTGYPVPAPPSHYDPLYTPLFMIIVSIDKEEALASVDKMGEQVDAQVSGIVAFTLVIGIVGIVTVIVVVFVVSRFLTIPLKWMNQVGRQIVVDFAHEGELPGDTNSHKGAIEYTRAAEVRCSPKTEIRGLVDEFEKMIQDFSGKGTTAKVFKKKLAEMKNPFSMKSAFRDLYWSREDPDFPYNYDVTANPLNRRENRVPQRRHFGRNIRENEADVKPESDTFALLEEAKSSESIRSSPLFWWIIGAVMTPLLLTMIIISTVVIWKVSADLPYLITDVKDAYLDLETSFLDRSVRLSASFASQVSFRPLRDVHVVSRISEWLFSGAIDRSDSFTGMASGVEECKLVPLQEECAFNQDKERAPCDCNWPNSEVFGTCANFDGHESRYLQRLFFAGQALDAWPTNGDRNSTSFPESAHSPASTEWWDDQLTVPNASKGSRASGHETTYDRLRVISALTAATIGIFNSGRTPGSPISMYLGFEADGMLIGYGGCDHEHTKLSYWKSSKENGASELRPDLCPLGRYGYDSRCRGWYSFGKERSMAKNLSPAYISPPYISAGNSRVSQSASMPIIDSKSGEHIGQTGIDFLTGPVLEVLRYKTGLAEGGFPILITTESQDVSANQLRGDTIVGPGFSLGDEGASIVDLVMPFDCPNKEMESNVSTTSTEKKDGKKPGKKEEESCKNRNAFEDIVKQMKSGESGQGTFRRTKRNGEEEIIHISFAPVTATNFRPMNNSDLFFGVTQFDSAPFSLALAEPLVGVLRPFEDVSNQLQRQVNVSLVALVVLIVLTAVFVLLMSARVTVSVTVPIAELLILVKNINRGNIMEDMPHLDDGPIEVSRVYGTFSRLYKVVRFANTAYFSGDLENAYGVLVDALFLFTQINNQKAIGVANNNLGNTMLTMYRTMKSTGETQICGMSMEDVINKGKAYFENAIKAGEEAIDRINEEQGFCLAYLVFMQQLANRYFNRAMFLLTVRDDDDAPEEAERGGFKDLMVARDMDIEFYDQSTQEGFRFDEEVRFNLVIGRIRGLLMLMGMYYPDEWDIEELFGDAMRELTAAIQNPSHNLFRDLGPAAQMQQLDATLIEYVEHDQNGVTEAARIGIRMLVEDEYILPECGSKAIQAVLNYVYEKCKEGEAGYSEGTRKQLLLCKQVFCRSQIKYKSRKKDMNSTIRESCRGDVTMEIF